MTPAGVRRYATSAADSTQAIQLLLHLTLGKCSALGKTHLKHTSWKGACDPVETQHDGLQLMVCEEFAGDCACQVCIADDQTLQVLCTRQHLQNTSATMEIFGKGKA